MEICSLHSGSSGNCIYVSGKDTKLLVDAGVSGTKVIKSLEGMGVLPSEINGILITHEHTDHIQGAGVLSRKLDLPIYATSKTWEAMSKKIGDVSLKNMREIEAGKDFYVGNVDVTPYSIPHDAVDPVAYNFMCGGKKIGICTDLGYMPKDVFTSIKDCDVLLLEANHDLEMLKCGAYPFELKRRISGKHGHLSNETCGNALVDMVDNVRSVMLGHLSRENNTEELAYITIMGILKKAGIAEKDMSVEVLKRDMHSKIYKVV